MTKNANLRKANWIKNDEFYTQLSDIENELKHYKEHFKNKIVYCNCDDPYESNFFKYFAMNFNFLWLKKLIVTSYSTSPVAHTQLNIFWDKKSYKIEINEVYDVNGDGAEDLADVKYLLESGKWKNKVSLLEWDWDFRSKECIEILKKVDIVVTNPPFSLFREYVAELIEYKKKFLIIWNKNALSYKEIFPLIKDNKVWLGYSIPKDFILPWWEITKKQNWLTRWFTNLDIKKRHEDLIMYKKYNKDDYLKFDNYDAINVEKTAEIPYDYDWIMWVPITFLDKYNPEQFEIIEWLNRYTILDLEWKNDWAKKNHIHFTSINWKSTYFRVLIRRKK